MNRQVIYVVRKRAMGDALWMEPVIRQLARKYKKVVVYTKFTDLFLNYPFDNVVFKNNLSLFEKIIWQFERILKTSYLFIDLEMAYETNPRTHLLNAYNQKARLPETEEYPIIYLNEKELATNPVTGNKYVVLHLESLTDKNYRKVYGIDWDAVVAYLESKGFATILVGKNSSNIKGAKYAKTSLREMIGVIHKSSFFIGIDSGPSHLASCQGIPALIFFGAVNPVYRHFKRLFRGYFLQQYCEFAGCYHETISKSGPSCRLVGDNGVPKCSKHTTGYVINHIDLLIKEYKIL